MRATMLRLRSLPGLTAMEMGACGTMVWCASSSITCSSGTCSSASPWRAMLCECLRSMPRGSDAETCEPAQRERGAGDRGGGAGDRG